MPESVKAPWHHVGGAESTTSPKLKRGLKWYSYIPKAVVRLTSTTCGDPLPSKMLHLREREQYYILVAAYLGTSNLVEPEAT